jgi:hypothetical protein
VTIETPQSIDSRILGPMFFGDTPAFDQIMTATAGFEATVNATAP